MNKSWQHRPPAAFRLDAVDVKERRAPELSGGGIEVTPEPEFSPPVVASDAMPSPRVGFRWGRLFWSASAGLALLAIGLAVTNLIEGLFARNVELGWFGSALAAAAALSLGVVVAKETIGLLRLATVERLHQRAASTLISDDRVAGRDLARELIGLTRSMPRLARSRATLESHLGDIIDGADMVRLAERELMAPLDQEARRLISAAATRVSVVTALSPRAAIDIVFVLGSAMILIRKLAYLYGVRPGTLGLVRLIRHVILQLAATGGLATSDSIVQQMLGHGIAVKLSARLGEGMLNGMLMARLGLAAIDTIRPLPFTVLSRPTLRDLMGELIRGYGDDERQRLPESSISQAPNG
jgi:putative membrane protein